MEKWNKLLKRQVWKHYGEKEIPNHIVSLFQSISNSYDHFERDSRLMERAMDLSSEELVSANAKLKKRNEELDKFVYSTSHDLRAPLTSIIGLLKLIELQTDPEKISKYLKLIEISAMNLDNFINDIIDYTHNSKKDIEFNQINFEELVSTCISKLDYMPNSEPIKKIVKIDSKAPFYSDYRRISNLISNLISNAIKYSSRFSEAPYLAVAICSDEENVRINVEDNGIGIKEEHLDKIFDMFYRASGDSKGSGIGLYIVKEIVEKLSGSISVESTFGEGTTFEISIPNNQS